MLSLIPFKDGEPGETQREELSAPGEKSARHGALEAEINILCRIAVLNAA